MRLQSFKKLNISLDRTRIWPKLIIIYNLCKIASIARFAGGRKMRVQDVMRKPVEMIDGSVTAAEAIKKMLDKNVSSLIVDHREETDAYGIITRKDIVSKIIAHGKNPAGVKVGELFSKPLVMASPGMHVKYAARLMSQHGLRRLPVFDGKKIIGMISNSDIFKACAKA